MTAGIYWEFLQAQHACKVFHKTIHVYLQKDMSLAVNKSISFRLPIKFHIKQGAVLLDTLDNRLVPASQIFLSHSAKDGLVVTYHNRGDKTLQKKAGETLCILRHVS